MAASCASACGERRRIAGSASGRLTPIGAARLWIALILLVICLPSCEQSSNAQSLSQLNGKVVELYNAGRYEGAIPFARKAVAVAEQSLGPEHPRTATSINNLALLYVATSAYAQAEPLYQRVLEIWEKVLGPEHPGTAQSLNNLASLYQDTGAYTQAEPLYQRALAIREKALGPEHPDTAAGLNNLASLYQDTGAYAQAEPLYKRALAIREKVLGPEHPDTALSLNNLAAHYQVIGDYAQAEPLYKRALAISEKSLGTEHPNTALSLNNLAMLYQATGAYTQAEPLYKRALAIKEKTLGPEHPDTATSLSNLAGLYWATGAYAQAEPLYKRALAIKEKTLGPEHPDTATSLNNLASLYQDTGAHAQAEPLYKRALAINEKVLGPEHPDTATSLYNLAALYWDTGAYAQAEPLFKRTLAINEKALGPEHPDTALSLNSLALLYETIGAYAQAEPLYKRALAIREKALGPEHPDTAVSLSNLAGLYWASGAYAQAEPLFKRTLAIFEKTLGPEHPDTATSLNNLAELYQATGASDQAEPLHQRALAIKEKTLGPEHPGTATSLDNLAVLYLATGTHAQAEPLFQRALAIREKALGPEHPHTATSLSNLASLYRATGANARAEPLLKRALAIKEKTLGPEHPDTATILNNLALLYWATGADARAESLLKRALAIREKALGPDHPDTATSLSSLARLDWAQGRWTDARDRFQRAARAHESVARAVLVLGDEARKRAFAATLVKESASLATFVLAARGQVSRAEELGLQVVLQRKGRVLDVMAGSLTAMRASLAPEDQQLFEQWRQSNAQYATLLFRGPEQTPLEEYRKLLDQLKGKAQTLEAQLSERSVAFRRQVETLTLERVQRVIPAGTVLMEWYRYSPYDPKPKNKESLWGAARYVVYVLKHEGAPVPVDIGEAKPIETLLSDLLFQLRDPRSTLVAELARELDELLMSPLRPQLGTAKRILISPDGQLNLLPFGVLRDEKGRYLAETSEITYLTSGRDLLRAADTPASLQPPAVLANPDFGPIAQAPTEEAASLNRRRSANFRAGTLQFGPLKGTAEEAQALQQLLGLQDERVLTGAKANEATLKTLKGPRILHLATHGFFLADQLIDTEDRPRPALDELGASAPLRENPLLRSGLALAGANQLRSGEDDGILTALEVSGLNLAGTELAVLSACDTGVGEVYNGEGVYGLRRALVLAGVQTQVASLWKVDDAATRDLMVDYYRHLKAGAGRSEALRQAQLALLADPQRAHPYFWAAFVVIGNDSPLKLKRIDRPRSDTGRHAKRDPHQLSAGRRQALGAALARGAGRGLRQGPGVSRQGDPERGSMARPFLAPSSYRRRFEP